jgi:large subunit ribosomal protein L5e
MAFVKVVKSKAYFKRFQVKYRRRREGKTDYYARKRLVQQDKNKYETPKFRFVVRRTNQRIICQVTFAKINGDRVLCQADSFELKKYGLESGLTNYSAAYATGLLCARRLLTDLGLAEKYQGVANANGEFFDVYEKGNIDEERRPFKAYLDVGLIRTTTGNRIFGALKGAVDGGIHIPHKNKRFPGYGIEEKKETYNADVHRKRIFGVHVQEYMDKLEADDKDTYKSHFSHWIKNIEKAKVKNLEDLYKKVHAAIRKDPKRVKVVRKQAPVRKYLDQSKTVIVDSKGRKYTRLRKITLAQRKQRVQEKIQKAIAAKQ